jgi:hypothetical protein
MQIFIRGKYAGRAQDEICFCRLAASTGLKLPLKAVFSPGFLIHRKPPLGTGRAAFAPRRFFVRF